MSRLGDTKRLVLGDRTEGNMRFPASQRLGVFIADIIETFEVVFLVMITLTGVGAVSLFDTWSGAKTVTVARLHSAAQLGTSALDQRLMSQTAVTQTFLGLDIQALMLSISLTFALTLFWLVLFNMFSKVFGGRGLSVLHPIKAWRSLSEDDKQKLVIFAVLSVPLIAFASVDAIAFDSPISMIWFYPSLDPGQIYNPDGSLMYKLSTGVIVLLTGVGELLPGLSAKVLRDMYEGDAPATVRRPQTAGSLHARQSAPQAPPREPAQPAAAPPIQPEHQDWMEGQLRKLGHLRD